jgi:hypothetical protein
MIVAKFFLTVSRFTVSKFYFVKYPFTSLVNGYSLDMLSLVNAWGKTILVDGARVPPT